MIPTPAFVEAIGLTGHQAMTLAVLVAVVGALILDRFRADVVALTGAAVLLMTGAVRPVDVQVAFASPAIIALAAPVRDRLRDGAFRPARPRRSAAGCGSRARPARPASGS